MHNNQRYCPEKLVVPPADQVGGCTIYNASMASVFGGTVLDPGTKYSQPLCSVEVWPSEVCPRNFIIFDQTHNRSQIMFHPAFASRFCYPDLNTGIPSFQHYTEQINGNDVEREIPAPPKEDSDDIDALLSFEEEEQEECDEEEVSTARTPGKYGSDSPDSCSNYSKKLRKSWLPSSLDKSTGSRNCYSEIKRQKMRKTVKALKAIVPGANRMSTVAALDEAVRYLKSLKVEVQKIGLGNLKK